MKRNQHQKSKNHCFKLKLPSALLKLLCLSICALSFQSTFALYYEVNADFGYDKQIYGANRLNSSVSRSYAGGLSTYVFEQTALDLSYTHSTDITTQNERYYAGSGYDLVSQQNIVETNVYGIGIKQMLFPRKFSIVPLISVGYARQFLSYHTDLTLENQTSGVRASGTSGVSKSRVDSMFGAFILQIKISDRLSIKGTVKTLFEAGEWNKARDNVKYTLGFSVIL